MKLILKSNMNARNLVTAMNMWAVAIVCKKECLLISGQKRKLQGLIRAEKTMTMQIVYKEKEWM